MKLIDKKSMTIWAYEQCLTGNDIEEIRSYFVEPKYVYLYCTHIKFRPEIRKLITDEQWNDAKNFIEADINSSVISSTEGLLHAVSKFVKNNGK